MSSITPFAFESHQVRVIADDQGAPWFVASDVARVLGYRDAANITRLLDDDEKGHRIVVTTGGDQSMTVISELGLFRMISKIRSPLGNKLLDVVLANVHLNQSAILEMFMDLDLDDQEDYFVYAAQEVDTGRIKIGISKNPEERLRTLQTSNSRELRLLHVRPAPNRFRDERALHSDASAYKIRGEWFQSGALEVLQ